MSNRVDRYRELLTIVADRERCLVIANALDEMGLFVDACNVLSQAYFYTASISDYEFRLATSWVSLVADPEQFLEDALDGLPAPAPRLAPTRRRSSSSTWQRDLAAGAAVA